MCFRFWYLCLFCVWALFADFLSFDCDLGVKDFLLVKEIVLTLAATLVIFLVDFFAELSEYVFFGSFCFFLQMRSYHLPCWWVIFPISVPVDNFFFRHQLALWLSMRLMKLKLLIWVNTKLLSAGLNWNSTCIYFLIYAATFLPLTI